MNGITSVGPVGLQIPADFGSLQFPETLFDAKLAVAGPCSWSLICQIHDAQTNAAIQTLYSQEQPALPNGAPEDPGSGGD